MNSILEQHIIPNSIANSLTDWPQKLNWIYTDQLSSWEMARNHYAQLNSIERKELKYDDFSIIVQHNKARARSTCADLKKSTIEKRPCFLCLENLPKEQKGFMVEQRYLLLVNPFPIFSRHYTISDVAHTPQLIDGRVGDMLNIAKSLTDFTVFYNGPKCGASAPDHFHFQAAPQQEVPLIAELNLLKRTALFESEKISITRLEHLNRAVVVFESKHPDSIVDYFKRLLDQLPEEKEWNEPMVNLFATYSDENYRLLVFPRKQQRPKCFYKEDENQILVSPASVEMGGLIVTPREKDYLNIDKKLMDDIYEEVSLLNYPFIFKK